MNNATKSSGPLTAGNSGWFPIVIVLVPSVIATACLYLITFLFSVPVDDDYSVLATLVFILSYLVYREVEVASPRLATSQRHFLQRSIGAWMIVIALLAVLGFALNYGEDFPRRVLLPWSILTPLLIAALQYWTYVVLVRNTTRGRTVIIAGITDLSRRLALALSNRPDLGLTLAGWVEDRDPDRAGPVPVGKVLGKLSDLAEYVKREKIDLIYIALPIRHIERTQRLLDDLHDTTASVYFVPDIFVYDLIQSRVDIIDGIPVLALCETPFVGLHGLIKRASDLLLASIILAFAAPIMIAVAIGVAFTTPGTIIFKQRRYGLDGEEFIVYKFRSMSASDDGADMPQARSNDTRTTEFGKFIRRLSLDELPQLVNVIQGRMSLVGPRPHAVTHNEEYRKLIKGYMIRHKVAPGITGLAQIRGHRGETKTVADMKARVEADLEYLRRWSLALDLKILALTVLRVFRDPKAY